MRCVAVLQIYNKSGDALSDVHMIAIFCFPGRRDKNFCLLADVKIPFFIKLVCFEIYGQG